MTALPASSDFTGSSITEAQFKTAMSDQRAFLAGLLGTTGTSTTALQTLGALASAWVSKTAAYTVAITDRGKVIGCSHATGFTLSLTAAATLGDGFSFAVLNYGTGTITIDPSGSEQIDGATTTTLAAGESCIVICTGGTAFRTLSKIVTPTLPAIRQVVSTTIPAATGGTAIPDDGTAPLITEGTEIASLSITPASASNTVKLSATFFVEVSVAAVGDQGVIATVWRGTTLVGSAKTQAEKTDSGLRGRQLSFLFVDSPASASSITYTVRIGRIGNGGSWYVSRTSGSATALGSSLVSHFIAEELTV